MLTVMRRAGSASPEAISAARTRSRASDTALSGRPTTLNAGKPGATCTCTSTARASIPSNATVDTRCTMRCPSMTYGSQSCTRLQEHLQNKRNWASIFRIQPAEARHDRSSRGAGRVESRSGGTRRRRSGGNRDRGFGARHAERGLAARRTGGCAARRNLRSALVQAAQLAFIPGEELLAMSTSDNAWPALAYADWADTCNTLHLWTQVVGKVKLRLAPLVNHWWGVVLFVTARGLTTGAMPYRGRTLQVDFDFCAHELVLRTDDAREQRVALRPMATADFYAAVMAALHALDVEVRMWTMPSEIEGAIPFEQDRVHASYDGPAAQPFWRQLVQAARVFEIFRARYVGKASPVHFFWGSFDLAVTRFS